MKKIIRQLKKWHQDGLITDRQFDQITEYEKAKSRDQFIRLIRVLFVVGAFWLIFGFIALVSKINLLLVIWNATYAFFYQVLAPLVNFAKLITPKHYAELLSGVACLVIWYLFHLLSRRLKERSNIELKKMKLSQERGLQLGVASATLGYIAASAAWFFLNKLLYPDPNLKSYDSIREFIVPYFSLIGFAFFLNLAYRLRDRIALLFGIGFLSHSIGFFTDYCFACYVIGVKMPTIQMFVGLLLFLIGCKHIENTKSTKDYFYVFGRTFQWTGLLLLFISLWIMALWGIIERKEYWAPPSGTELWIANILFIFFSLFFLFLGAKKEDRMFFNFGLTFFIIESYTVFFSRLWSTIGTATGALLLGALLISTGYVLRSLWLRGLLGAKHK